MTASDKANLIEEIHQLSIGLDYVNPKVFARLVRHIVNAFLIGRGDKSDPDTMIQRLITYARRVNSPQPAIEFFRKYARRVSAAEENSQLTEEHPLRELAKRVFPKTILEVENFGHASASDTGDDIALTTLGGFLHVFESSADLRSHGLRLLSVADEIERARVVVPSVGIEPGYAAKVLEEFEEMRIANSWLYPPKDQD